MVLVDNGLAILYTGPMAEYRGNTRVGFGGGAEQHGPRASGNHKGLPQCRIANGYDAQTPNSQSQPGHSCILKVYYLSHITSLAQNSQNKEGTLLE